MTIEKKQQVASQLTTYNLPNGSGYLHCIGEDHSMFLILEKNLNQNLSYAGIKINIPRERAVTAQSIYFVQEIEVNANFFKELKYSIFTYITGTAIESSYLADISRVIKTPVASTALNQGRAFFINRLFNEFLQVKIHPSYIYLMSSNPLQAKQNLEHPLKQRLEILADAIRADQDLPSAASIKQCSLI